MGLFSKITVDSKMMPYIQKGEGIGIVQINGQGECCAWLENNNIIMESHKTHSIVRTISMDEINMISFDPGNFFNEARIDLGIQNAIFTIKGYNDNDNEVENFYHTIINIKEQQVAKMQTQQPQRPPQPQQTILQQSQQHNNQQPQKAIKPEDNDDTKTQKHSKSGMPHPTNRITNPNKMPNNHRMPEQENRQRPNSPQPNYNQPPNQRPNSMPNYQNPNNQRPNQPPIQRQADPQQQANNQNPAIPPQQVRPNNNNASNQQPAYKEVIDPVEEIKRYYELMNEGIITYDEFKKKKEQLLNIGN